MAAPQRNPEVTSAVVKGSIAEGVLLAVGLAVYLGTGQIAWIIGAIVLGSAILLLLMAQAGAFTRR
ncbi:MAG: hypothetical protein ABL871_18500 [Terricaulis sp.]